MALSSHVTEASFSSFRQPDWHELDMLTGKAIGRGLRGLSPAEVARLSPLYRDVCADLARAQAARYSAPLVDYLESLAAVAHTVIYSRAAQERAPRARWRRGARARFLVAFPRVVRRRWRPVLLATLLFFVPLALGVLAALEDPRFAFRIVPEAQLRDLTEVYASGFEHGRKGGENALMAGFYVNNNVSIALRCFATGVFGGLGSAFYLVQNGLSIGAVLGYVTSQGAGQNILTFIIGHGSLELGAIVIAGAAGLALGWSIVAPGELARVDALQRTAREVVVLVAGAAVMLLLAAALEGFWSGSSVAAPVKHGVGVTILVLLLGYLVLAGRGEVEDEPWKS